MMMRMIRMMMMMICVYPLRMLLFTNYLSTFTSPTLIVYQKKYAYKEIEDISI